MWLMAKKTLDSSEENCWGYELNINWHWSRNGWRSLGFEPLKVLGGLIRVCWVGGANEGGGGGGCCPTQLNALMSCCSTLVVVLAGGGGSSHSMGGNGTASTGEVSGGSTISVSSSIDKCQGNGNLCLN